MIAGSCWQLCAAVDGFAAPTSHELVTQVAIDRSFQLINDLSKDSCGRSVSYRVEVRLLEDGYRCWLDLSELFDRAFQRGPWEPLFLDKDQIQSRIPSVLKWLDKAAGRENNYLWGGTIGPDFDCSGLVQAAFASQEIWLPRDAYQQEKFCETLKISFLDYQTLWPGDLLFFGTLDKCTHVAIYLGAGVYCHSSGVTNGWNGIGCNRLQKFDKSSVACFYRSQLRSLGRVVECHDGSTLP